MPSEEEKDSHSAYYYVKETCMISLYSVNEKHVIRYRCVFADGSVSWSKTTFEDHYTEDHFTDFLQTHTQTAQLFIGEFYENIGLKRMKPPKTALGYDHRNISF